MKKTILGLFVVSILLASAVFVMAGGFDEFGYNDNARVFVGPADGVDRNLDGKVWGDSTYANDHLKMKWNSEWDRGNAEGWSDPAGYDAWEDNQWNGMLLNGSGETWHYKIKWDQGCKDNSTPSTEGGFCIWGQFAVVMSHGTFDGEHFWDTHANPAGYGN